MSRDYKHRGQPSRRESPSVPAWKWLAVSALIGLFVWFLVDLKERAPSSALLKPVDERPAPEKKEITEKMKPPSAKVEAVEPRFDFYTILPQDEVVIPDHEIKTTKREEALGKAKPGSYILQAGSFRSYPEADKIKARLALLGIEAKIETAKVGGVTWNRIKIGPYANMSTVDKIRSRLRQNNIDVVVIKSNR